MTKTFYITTAIDYPNGAPHMGHAYEKIVTDVYARWYRLQGRDTFFLTGTDENGQKLVKSAEACGQETRAFVDAQVDGFRALCATLDISHDDFIRTTETRHRDVAHALWKSLAAHDAIFFDRYSGEYCLACETFYTPSQLVDGKCPEHGTPLSHVSEEGYFLRLSKYHDFIVEFLRTHPNFVVPAGARKELISRLEQDPLKDLSISRPNHGWGVPVPGDDRHVMYTWFDALINYYAATRAPADRQRFWPANVHVIGRDIIWFHCVIWPIMLHIAQIALPEQVYVHGMVLAEDGRKMSKSLNNGVDPRDALAKVPVDSFRYYLLRAISSGQDGAFSPTELINKHNNELANDYGNLAMRVIKLARKKLGDAIAVPETVVVHQAQSAVEGEAPRALPVEGATRAPVIDAETVHAQVSAAMDAREHTKALEIIWRVINDANAYLNTQAPWKIPAEDPKLHEVLYYALYSVYVASALLQAFIPTTATQMLSFLGVRAIEFPLTPIPFSLSEPTALFPKIDVATNATA